MTYLCLTPYKLFPMRSGTLSAVFVVTSVAPRQMCDIWEVSAKEIL